MNRILNTWTRTLSLAVLLLAVVLSGSCNHGEAAPTDLKQLNFSDDSINDDRWLIYWYICGTDLETRFGSATEDLAELMDVDLPPNVKVLIQTGGAEEWQNDVVKDNAIGRYLYDGKALHELEQLKDADMGSPDTLADFLEYGDDNFDPDYRVFIFWDHGGGSAGGVCYDEHTGNALSLNDIRDAFTDIYDAAPEDPPFELIGFDACLMATYDVANTLYGFTRYMTASEETIPGNGFAYDLWVDALAKESSMDGAELGEVICDTYVDGCKDEETDDTITLSVIDLSKIPALRRAYEAYGTEALRCAAKDPKGFFSAFGRNAKRAENYGGNTRDQGYSDMVDLGDLAQETRRLLPETSQDLIRAVDDAVVYKVHGDYRRNGSGISGFYSYDNDEDTYEEYADQDAAPLSMKCLYYYLIYGELPQEANQFLTGNAGQGSSSILHPVLSQAHKMFTLSDLEDLPVDIDDKGNSFITLSEEQMDLLSAVHCNLIAVGIEEDILLNLGSDADIDGDWNTGVFKDNFRGVWPMLDGHPVYIEITAEEDDYNLYSVPIKLNGEECNLQVSYSYTDEKYHILGARKRIEDNGMGSRKLVRLKKGDKITTIHYVMTISGDDDEYTPVDVDTFTIGSQPKMEDEDLGDGDYFYYFEFISPTGNSATSKLVEFTVENGHIFTSVDD